MTKNRIVALLLAGLMAAAALTSCRVQGNFDDPSGTEPNQNDSSQTTTTKPDDPYTPTTTWSDVDKTVYAISEIKLRSEASNTSTALCVISVEAELHCTKQNASWYYVEYNGQTGYISKTSVNESKFVPINETGSKVMYANDKTINVRLYPSENATIVGYYSLNDEATVIASNGAWYKVQYDETKTYYVSTKCLSDTKWVDPDDDASYQELFTAVNGDEGIVRYVNVNGGKVNFRKAPNTSASIIMSLTDGCEVTVLKTGVVNGMNWSYVVVKVKSDKVGVPDEYKYGYISSDYLSITNGDITLENILLLYPSFTQIDAKTMYVIQEKTITIRSTPSFPGDSEASNILSNPQSGTTPESIKSIKVLATGVVDGTTWYFVEFTKKDGENETLIRGFIGGKALDCLTSNANGKVTVTIEDLIVKYPEFVKLETPTKITTTSVANCYGTPDAGSDVLGQLAAGTEVTLVAQESGTRASWYVIQTAQGDFFFVGKQFFN